jgi:hypothetical protein
VEADLQRFYAVDYRDRWRRGSGLTLRRISVLVDHLPEDSALHLRLNEGEPVPSLTDVLLADIWQAVTRSKRPHKVIRNLQTRSRSLRVAAPDRQRAIARARRRAARRRALIESGEIQ